MTDAQSLEATMAHLGAHRVAPWAPPTPADFDRLQASVGRLPEEYVALLSGFGGVILGHEDFGVQAPIAEPCPWGTAVGPEIFYPLDPKSRHSVEKQLRTYKGRLPAGVLPIADDAGGNQICLDVAGAFPGSVWFWDHEQRWFREAFAGSLEDAAREVSETGVDTRRFSAHDIIRSWARLHDDRFDRPPDYVGMYRLAPTFGDFLRALHRVAPQ